MNKWIRQQCFDEMVGYLDWRKFREIFYGVVWVKNLNFIWLTGIFVAIQSVMGV